MSEVMATIHQRLLGRNDGNFSPHQINFRDFTELVSSSFCSRPDDADEVIFPQCNYTNRVVLLGKEDYRVAPKFNTTRNPADGVVVDQMYTAGVIFNADAPVVRIFEPGRTRFAVLNAAFRCLMPALDGKGKRERSIIRVAIEDFKFNPQEVQVWAGVGIGPCCYGAEHWPETNDTSVDIPVSRATRGPRAGKRSIDLFEMIRKQLLKLGVKSANIKLDVECTCCKGYFFGSPYHSHCRSGIQAGRNGVGFWML